MTNVRDLLKDADPVRHESAFPLGQLEARRRAVLAATSQAEALDCSESRSRTAAFAIAIVVVAAALLLGTRVRNLLVGELQAAVRFEVKLAEDNPAPGLRAAKISGSDRTVYLHEETIVNNGDIAAATVIQGNEPSQYWVSIEFNTSGSDKLQQATQNHIGKPVAILLDGKVAFAPTLRSPISASAIISGNYTKTEAERIANGIGKR